MNLKEKYLEWHCNTIVGQPLDEVTNQVIQFCDDFMEQCDKLEKKVNDLAREKRQLANKVKTLEGSWELNQSVIWDLRQELKQKGD